MYNRYVPQPDGTYAKTRHPDQEPKPTPQVPCPPDPPPCPEPDNQPVKAPPCPHRIPPRTKRPPAPRQEHREPEGMGVGAFLRQLLPKDFDTGDLIVVLLLLLMSSDCKEDQNTALLTLALYLFL